MLPGTHNANKRLVVHELEVHCSSTKYSATTNHASPFNFKNLLPATAGADDFAATPALPKEDGLAPDDAGSFGASVGSLLSPLLFAPTASLNFVIKNVRPLGLLVLQMVFYMTLGGQQPGLVLDNKFKN